MACAASIEAESELVEVGLEMIAAETVVDAQGPAFEVGEDAAGPRQDEMGGHGADDMRIVVDLGGAEIGGQSVGLERRTGSNVGGDEGADAFSGR